MVTGVCLFVGVLVRFGTGSGVWWICDLDVLRLGFVIVGGFAVGVALGLLVCRFLVFVMGFVCAVVSRLRLVLGWQV